MKQLLLLPFVFLVFNYGQRGNSKIGSINLNNDNQKLLGNKTYKTKPMGISINLYRVGKAEKFEDLKNLDAQISKTEDTRVNLYKITEDLALIFLNTTDPFSDVNTIPYKMLYGRHCEKSIVVGVIGGFLPTSEITEITKWIKKNKLDTFDGFSKMYDGLSNDVKKQLEDIDEDDKVSLFNCYVRPLVVLYFTALENQNSVVFVGQ